MVDNSVYAAAENNSLDEIIGRIVEVAHPEKIILFGSSATRTKRVRRDEQRRYKRLRRGQRPEDVLRAPWGRPSARAAPWRVRHHRELLRRAAAGARATDGKTLMIMVQRGFPSAELRDEHRAGFPTAFARLEQTTEELVSPLRQGDPS
jgi:hypothetical protein